MVGAIGGGEVVELGSDTTIASEILVVTNFFFGGRRTENHLTKNNKTGTYKFNPIGAL